MKCTFMFDFMHYVASKLLTDRHNAAQQTELAKRVQLIHEIMRFTEADKDMVAYLETHYPELKPNIIAGDFLKMRFERTRGTVSKRF